MKINDDILARVRGAAFADELLKAQKEQINIFIKIAPIAIALNKQTVEQFSRLCKISLADELLKTIDIKTIDKLYSDIGRTLATASLSFKFSDIYGFTVPNYLSSVTGDALSVCSTSTNLVKSIKGLSNNFENEPQIINDIKTIITRPPIEVASHNHSLHVLGFSNYNEPNEFKTALKEELQQLSSETEIIIQSANPDWLPILNGAEQAIISTNEDKIRHSCISLRELLTNILHTLAPDKEIKKAYSDPSFYHDNKPTRKTRIKYILSKRYSNDKLADFIEKDIDAVIALLNLLHSGAHAIPCKLSEGEVKFLISRTKLTILNLITTNQ
jgi:hypothetical protein